MPQKDPCWIYFDNTGFAAPSGFKKRTLLHSISQLEKSQCNPCASRNAVRLHTVEQHTANHHVLQNSFRIHRNPTDKRSHACFCGNLTFTLQTILTRSACMWEAIAAANFKILSQWKRCRVGTNILFIACITTRHHFSSGGQQFNDIILAARLSTCQWWEDILKYLTTAILDAVVERALLDEIIFEENNKGGSKTRKVQVATCTVHVACGIRKRATRTW